MSSSLPEVNGPNVIDFSVLSTESGDSGPFAPPPGWRGSEEVYRVRIKEALLHSRNRHQQFLTLQHWESMGRNRKPGFVGPFADAAAEIYHDLKRTLNNAT